MGFLYMLPTLGILFLDYSKMQNIYTCPFKW